MRLLIHSHTIIFGSSNSRSGGTSRVKLPNHVKNVWWWTAQQLWKCCLLSMELLYEWNIKSRISNITNEIATKRKTEHKREPYSHSHSHSHSVTDTSRTQKHEGMNFKKELHFTCTLLPHARMHTLHITHAQKRERCHSLIIPFLLVRLISSLVRSKGLCNSVFFLFPFLSFAFLCSSWSSFFCRNALWWLLRVIRNSPTVSRAH